MPATLRPSWTLMDGTTFQKEFPVWVSAPAKNNFAENAKSEFKQGPSSKENVYYETLKPIFFVLTLAGVLPVYKLNFGSHKLRVVLLGGVCLAMYLIFAYFTYNVTIAVIHIIFHDDDFGSIIDQVSGMMLLMQHVFYLLLSWPESLAVYKYLIEWKHFQTRFEHVSKSKLTLSCKKKIVSTLCLGAVLSFGFMAWLGVIHLERAEYRNNFGKTAHMVYGYHLFMLVCFYILWFSNSWAVTEAAQQYSDHLSQECMLDITSEKLEEYRLLWMRLTEIVRSGSSMLSYTMAVMVTNPFAYEVIAAYNLTMFAIRSIQFGLVWIELDDAIFTLCFFIFYSILLYMFCNSGHHMTVKCEQIQDVLLTHKPRSPSEIAKVNSELRLFLRCLRSVPPCATLSGYVTISRKVFLHLSGVLVTYLIILVQFNIGSLSNEKKPTPASMIGTTTSN